MIYYFAHPYSGNEEANHQDCCYRTAQLLKQDYLVFSPICHSHHLDIFLEWNWEQWLEHCTRIITRINFDGIILAPGWEKSRGCCAEYKLFEAANKPVLYYEDIIKEGGEDEQA